MYCIAIHIHSYTSEPRIILILFTYIYTTVLHILEHFQLPDKCPKFIVDVDTTGLNKNKSLGSFSKYCVIITVLMSELRSASVKCPLPRLGTGWVLGVTAPPNDLPSHPLLPFHNWHWEISPLRPGTGRRRKLPGN